MPTILGKDIYPRAVEPKHLGFSVANAFAGDLTLGMPVYISGVITDSTDARFGMFKVTKADCDATFPANIATHIVVETIPQNGAGRVARALTLRDQDTSTWTTVGDPVYVSATAGQWSPTAPTGTDANVQRCGYVAVKSASVGIMVLDVSAAPIQGASTATLLAANNAWTGTNDYSKTLAGTDELINVDMLMTHATQIAVAEDITYGQNTNARTANYLAGIRIKGTSLAGDLNSVLYPDIYHLAPTDGGGTVIHVGDFYAGGDYAWLAVDNVLTGWGTGTDYAPDIAMGWDGTRFNITQLTVNSEIRSGIDGAGIDWRFYTDTAGCFVLLDQSADTLQFADSTKLVFGTGSDITFLWDGTDLLVSQAAPDSNIKWGVSGAGINHVFYGDTATYDLSWDQTNNQLLFNDNAKLTIGTGNDIVFLWDGTDLLVSQAAPDSTVKWGVSGAGINHVFYGDTATQDMTWDQTNSQLLFNDNALMAVGTGAGGVGDIAWSWDGTRCNVTQLTVNSEIRWGVDGAGIDQRWYTDTASAYLLLDQSSDSLERGGVFADLHTQSATTPGRTISVIGPDLTHGQVRRVLEATLSPNAIETALLTLPANSRVVSLQANIESALTGGGTTVTVSFGITGDVDAYGTMMAAGVQSDLLTKNAKADFIGTIAANAGASLGVFAPAAVSIKMIGAVAGGATAGDTALTVGSVKVRIVYDTMLSIADAA